MGQTHKDLLSAVTAVHNSNVARTALLRFFTDMDREWERFHSSKDEPRTAVIRLLRAIMVTDSVRDLARLWRTHSRVVIDVFRGSPRQPGHPLGVVASLGAYDVLRTLVTRVRPASPIPEAFAFGDVRIARLLIGPVRLDRHGSTRWLKEASASGCIRCLKYAIAMQAAPVIGLRHIAAMTETLTLDALRMILAHCRNPWTAVYTRHPFARYRPIYYMAQHVGEGAVLIRNERRLLTPVDRYEQAWVQRRLGGYDAPGTGGMSLHRDTRSESRYRVSLPVTVCTVHAQPSQEGSELLELLARECRPDLMHVALDHKLEPTSWPSVLAAALRAIPRRNALSTGRTDEVSRKTRCARHVIELFGRRGIGPQGMTKEQQEDISRAMAHDMHAVNAMCTWPDWRPVHKAFVDSAVARKHVPVLKWHASRYPEYTLTHTQILRVANSGRAPLLKWVLSSECRVERPVNARELADICVANGSLACLRVVCASFGESCLAPCHIRKSLDNHSHDILGFLSACHTLSWASIATQEHRVFDKGGCCLCMARCRGRMR